jgi:hypothetical protein
MFSKKCKLTHCWFKSSPSMYSNWIDCVNIFIFRSIHVSATDAVYSIFPPRCRLSSDRHHHTTTSCHASFSWRQDKLAVFASFFDNTLLWRLPLSSQNWSIKSAPPPPSATLSDSPTFILHRYKNVISILVTLHHLTTSQFYLIPN